MDFAATLGIALTFFFLPVAWMLIDSIGGLRAKHSAAVNVGSYIEEDFAVLVPIYGNIAYLENIHYLAGYGSRVVLCTTTHESDEFNTGLQEIAAAHGFRTFHTDAARTGTPGQRATGGTIRDTVIRDVLPHLTEHYVVCIDADTTSVEPLQRLVGAMRARGLDVASVRLVPSNGKRSILTRLQSYEYRLAMRLRIIAPWLVSGACHAGRTSVVREIMARHSLFFQGNDVELGGSLTPCASLSVMCLSRSPPPFPRLLRPGGVNTSPGPAARSDFSSSTPSSACATRSSGRTACSSRSYCCRSAGPP